MDIRNHYMKPISAMESFWILFGENRRFLSILIVCTSAIASAMGAIQKYQRAFQCWDRLHAMSRSSIE